MVEKRLPPGWMPSTHAWKKTSRTSQMQSQWNTLCRNTRSDVYLFFNLFFISVFIYLRICIGLFYFDMRNVFFAKEVSKFE